MQLLVEHSEGLPVIHVVHRESTYFPPRAELERAVAPHRRPSDDPSEGSPPAAQRRTSYHNERTPTYFNLERDHSFEDAATIRLQEAQAPVVGSLTTSDPLDDRHGIHHRDSTGSLGAHGYNTSIQSTFHFSADSSETEALPRDIADMRLQRTLLRLDAEYPEYIRDTLAYVSGLPPARTNYYPLWNHVLEYWFPHTEGFDIVQDWDPSTSSFGAYPIEGQRQNDARALQRPNPSFAVFDAMFPTQPFLCVNVHSALPVSEFMKVQAREALEEMFETLKACSAGTGLNSLCVVSAVGAKWGMVVREPGWSQSDLQLEIGNDCIGEWEEDVTSPESFSVMRYYLEEMKRGFEEERAG